MPKVNFKLMSLEENIELVSWILLDEEFDKTPLFEWFPKLRDIDTSEKDVNKKIASIVEEVYISQRENIMQSIDKYNVIWKKYSDSFFASLEKVLNTSWPKGAQNIDAYVGILTVFPRNLDDMSFYMCTNVDENILIDSVAHECLHFLWFEKWKSMFPDFNREEFDYPYLVWRYSEMVVDPILNNTDIQRVLNCEIRAYDYFYELKDKDEFVMDNLNRIFASDSTIEDKIMEGYEYIKKLEIF